jgi:hypothetical protein
MIHGRTNRQEFFLKITVKEELSVKNCSGKNQQKTISYKKIYFYEYSVELLLFFLECRSFVLNIVDCSKPEEQ